MIDANVSDDLYAGTLAAARRVGRVIGAIDPADPLWTEALTALKCADELLREAAAAMPDPELPSLSDVAAIEIGSLFIDAEKRMAAYGSATLPLSTREFDVLCALARDHGSVITKERMLEQVWRWSGVRTRTVDSHVSRVRRHLVRAGAPEGIIRNVWGIGWSLEAAS